MHSRLYKTISIFLFLILSTSQILSQSKTSKIALDALIINKNANTILKHKLNSSMLSKRGIEFTAKYHDTQDKERYTLFDVPVESIEVILVNNELISLEIKLEENNDRIEHIINMFVKYLGNYNAAQSKITNSQKKLFFEDKENHFLIDAFSETDTNMGHLSVGYITQKFIALDKKMRTN
ncbi:hypothetical protein [Lacinutrix chionoecetis]